jgi:hypothetical protein
MLSTVVWVLENYGIGPETLSPYDIQNGNKKPPESYVQQAAKDEPSATRLDATAEREPRFPRKSRYRSVVSRNIRHQLLP